MQSAQAGEFRGLQRGNGAEQPNLLAVFELGLKADHVEQRAEPVVLAQLHHRIGLFGRPMRIGESDRLHRAVTQRLAAPLRHDLDGKAAVEIGGACLPVVERHGVGGAQAVDEGLVAGPVERTIDVIGASAAGARLVVTRLQPSNRHVDRIAIDDGRDRIEEGERRLTGRGQDRFGKGGRGEGAGGDDHAVPIRGGQACDLLAAHLDQGVSVDRFADGR